MASLQPSDTDIFIKAAERFDVGAMREHQLEVCLEYYNGRDSFFTAPTGFGKSLVYQVAPLAFNSKDRTSQHRILIIQPTIALIEDSISKLERYVPELPAVHLTPATLTKAKSAIYIFTSPEMLLGDIGRRVILTDVSVMASVAAVFVDECHMVEEWGASGREPAFRELYSQLGTVRSFTDSPFVAMSATVNSETAEYIKRSLNMLGCRQTKVNIDKINISYHVVSAAEEEPNNFDFVIQLLKAASPMPRTLIFFNEIKQLTAAYSYITHNIGQQAGDPSPTIAMYMSVTDGERKHSILSDLNNPNGVIKLVLCTSSLAVGINVSDVMYTIHYGTPTLAQDFLQETGRAARESSAHGHSILITFPRENPKGLSKFMKAFKKGRSCRRALLLAAFNSSSTISGLTKCCDVCNTSIDHPFRAVVNSYFSKNSLSDTDSSLSSDSSEPSLSNLDFD